MSGSEAPAALRARPPAWRYGLEILAVFAVFCLQGPWGIPDSNEPNYLAKARHYWDPSWLPGDFFLDTADAHLVFYFSWGWLTRFLTLPHVALVGRMLTWSLLAWSWTRLSWRVVPRPWMAVASAGLLVALHSRIEMAGEWLIGGAEGKGFAYVLVFWGLGSLARGGWNAAWISFGAASAFHVLVGGWSCVAAGMAWLAAGRFERSLTSMIPGLALGALLALPGVLPGLAMSRGATADEAHRAAEIQVFDRLAHHLYFPWFERSAIESHLMAAGLWALFLAAVYLSVRDPARLRGPGPVDSARRLPASQGWLSRACGLFAPDNLRGRALGRRGWRVHAVVAGALAISLLGVLLSLYVWRTTSHEAARVVHSRLGTSLLRFYWFRLGDVLLPAGVALALARLAAAWPARGRSYAIPLALMLAVGLVHLGLKGGRSGPPPAYREGPADSYSDWLALCHWAEEQTPPDALFITPRNTTTFRWYSNRADVANFKDMPQDTRGLVDWWDRLLDIHYDPSARAFFDSLTERTPADLRRLGAKYGATYLVADTFEELDLPVAYRNGWFVAYRLDGG